MQRVAAVGEELVVGAARVPALVLDARERRGDRRRVAGEDGAQQVVEELEVEAAEQAHRVLLGDAAGAEGGELVEQRHRVAHAALAGAGEQAQRAVGGLDRLGVAQIGAGARASVAALTRRKWNSWQRDRIVAGTASISVVAKMKTRCGGGSSTILSSASNAWRDRRWISSSTTTL